MHETRGMVIETDRRVNLVSSVELVPDYVGHVPSRRVVAQLDEVILFEGRNVSFER